MRSCRNRCGTSYICSCKPMCQYLKTCCIDFLEACGHEFNLSQAEENYRWLESVDTQCMFEALVVSSCRPYGGSWEDAVLGYANENQDLSFISGNHPENTTERDRTKNTNRLAEAILSLLATSLDKVETLSEVEMAFLSMPLLDQSTGISYKNISVYTCNGASLIRAEFWTILVPTPQKGYISASDLEKIPDIFKLVDFSDACPVLQFQVVNRLSDDSKREHCMDHLVNSCPKDFHDEEVVKACEKTHFVMTGKGVKSSEDYKNPFCLFCNLGEDKLLSIRPHRVPNRHLCLKGSLTLTFKPFGVVDSSYDFTITEQSGREGLTFHPIWVTSTCTFLWSSNDSVGAETKSTNETELQSKTKRASFQSHCRVLQCPKGVFRNNTCNQMTVFPLVLPPTRIPLEDDVLDTLLNEWNNILLQHMPEAEYHNLTESVVTFRRSEFVIRSRSPYVNVHVGYIVYGALFYEMNLKEPHVSSALRNSVVEMLTQIDFPFQKDKRYVCIGFGLTMVPIAIHDRIRVICRHNAIITIPTNRGEPCINVVHPLLQTAWFWLLSKMIHRVVDAVF